MSKYIRNHDICIKQTFILVKDLKEKTLVGIPFLSSIYPLWVDNQGIRTKLFLKEILFEFANPVENITLCDQEINLVRIDDPPKIIGTQFIHNLIINDILSIPLCISKYQTNILKLNFQIKFIKGESFIPNHSTCGTCRIHKNMAPKKEDRKSVV